MSCRWVFSIVSTKGNRNCKVTLLCILMTNEKQYIEEQGGHASFCVAHNVCAQNQTKKKRQSLPSLFLNRIYPISLGMVHAKNFQN